MHVARKLHCSAVVIDYFSCLHEFDLHTEQQYDVLYPSVYFRIPFIQSINQSLFI